MARTLYARDAAHIINNLSEALARLDGISLREPPNPRTLGEAIGYVRSARSIMVQATVGDVEIEPVKATAP